MVREIGIQIITPDGSQLTNSVIIAFPMSNNETKYEVVLVGMRMAIALQVKFLRIFNDSKLVVDQDNGQMLIKDTRMVVYKTLVLKKAKHFEDIAFIKVWRKENLKADQLVAESS